MKLHTDLNFFDDTIRAASQQSALAFTEIPEDTEVAKQFKKLIDLL